MARASAAEGSWDGMFYTNHKYTKTTVFTIYLGYKIKLIYIFPKKKFALIDSNNYTKLLKLNRKFPTSFKAV